MQLLRRRRSLIALAFVAGTIAMAPFPQRRERPAARLVRIEASQFAYSPGTIAVNLGDTVTLELVSKDVVHGLFVDGYEQRISADPGQTAAMSFVANRPGMFRLRCSVTCGALHPFMVGQLHVGRNALGWRAMSLALLAALCGLWLLPLGGRPT